jgi:hypothetical protein
MKKLLWSIGMAAALTASAGVDGLNGAFRNGQLFLQWNESNLAPDTRLSVWSSDKPITKENVSSAVKAASLINVNSARDWWLDPDSFVIKRGKKAKGEEIFAGNVTDVGEQKKQVRGFVIENNGKPISAKGGLHVHTPAKAGKYYFAVTTHKGFSDEITGFTATSSAIECGKGKATPIRLKGNFSKDSAKGMPLTISLHGRGGGVGVDKNGKEVGNHIIFSDSDLAWREGIPFKFSVYMAKENGVQISLNDRVWIGRKLNSKESRDLRDYVPAISTFWLGYNVNIGKDNYGPKFVWDNYTERLIIHIAKWAQDYLGADKNRTYITGGSMGGTGTVQMVTHYPEFFAAGFAQVPIYAFTWNVGPGNKQNSAWRMTCSIGKFTEKNPARMLDGTDLVDYCNGAANIGKAAIDMPPLFATNGRNDGSIPWVNNPPFYRAANEGRQMFTVFWNNGNHGMSRQTPKDFNMRSKMMRYRLNESFPAFSNLSDNKNYGNGNYKDGDIVGWVNRGVDWKVIADTPDRYEITLSVGHPQIKYPVTSDVTIRRRQQFKPEKGSTVNVLVNGKKSKAVIDDNGLLTIKNITFANSGKVKVVCTK